MLSVPLFSVPHKMFLATLLGGTLYKSPLLISSGAGPLLVSHELPMPTSRGLPVLDTALSPIPTEGLGNSLLKGPGEKSRTKLYRGWELGRSVVKVPILSSLTKHFAPRQHSQTKSPLQGFLKSYSLIASSFGAQWPVKGQALVSWMKGRINAIIYVCACLGRGAWIFGVFLFFGGAPLTGC